MSTLQEPTSTAKPKAVDPETVTISGYAVDQLYGPEQVHTTDPNNTASVHARIGQPGQFPYTRGIHKNMYLGRLWTMRQFAGFGSSICSKTPRAPRPTRGFPLPLTCLR